MGVVNRFFQLSSNDSRFLVSLKTLTFTDPESSTKKILILSRDIFDLYMIMQSAQIMYYDIHNFHESWESENAFQSWVVKFEMVKYAKFGFNRLIFHKNSLEMD